LKSSVDKKHELSSRGFCCSGGFQILACVLGVLKHVIILWLWQLYKGYL